MSGPTLLDASTGTAPMAEGRKRWKTKAQMAKVGGEKGKLHRELGIPEGDKIPKARLHEAANSKNPEIARDAKRAETMESWDHRGAKRRKKLYG